MRVNKMATAVIATAAAGSLALGGFTAAVAVADDNPRNQISAVAPLPSAQELSKQTELIRTTHEALVPVTELLEAVLKVENGKLTQEQADRHAKAVKEALAPLMRTAPEKQTQEQTREQARKQAQQVAPNSAARESVAQNEQQTAAQRDVAAPEVSTAKAAAELQAQVEAMLEVSVAGDMKKVDVEAKGIVKGIVDLLGTIITGGVLPESEVKGQELLPQLPEAEKAPQQPTEVDQAR